MVKFLSQYSKWIVMAFGLLAFGLVQSSWLTEEGFWKKTEGELIDRRYVLRGYRPADTNIVLVGLGTSAFQLDTLSSNEIAASPTLQLMQEPWPWDRRVYAAVLQKLMDAGAKAVMFDFVFASETDGDDEFAKVLQKYKDHVVIGEMFSDEKGSDNKTKRLIQPNNRLLLSGTENVPGLVNILPDDDEVVRRARYRTSVERETLESDVDPRVRALLKKRVESGQSPDNLTHATLLTAEKFKGDIATPAKGQYKFIDFQGPGGTYRPLPIENMFVDELWKAPPFSDGLAFSNKIVVVGPMAEIFHDVHTTPFGETPGPEVQAQILAALLNGSWLIESPWTINLGVEILLVFLALVICLRISNALLKVFMLVLVAVGFLIVCQILFTKQKLVLPMTAPLFCLVVPGAFGIVFQYALEQFERLRMRGVLGRYVSENVAKAVLEDKRSFEESLRGQKKPVTILFSDIRGFTSMTETADANKLVAQLNEYFGEMVDIIEEKNQGTLQKFIGDAIMAAWGDVYSKGIDVDASRAVTAALQMRPALAKLNTSWKNNPDRQNLSIGIGVNHGEVVYGNIGSHKRMELTVLGDGVNLAARLESATKQFHADILIGEETEKLTRSKFIYRSVGAIAFKGKTKPIEVFMLLGDSSMAVPEWLATYHAAVKLYRAAQFEKAITLFRETAAAIGGEDYLCEMYISICNDCLQQALPNGWDGSIKLSEK